MSLILKMSKQRINVCWFKCTDMRLHDHEAYVAAHSHGLPVLHLFVFDERWFRPLPLTGLIKTGPIRAQFWREAVGDLRENLQSQGGELVVRRGKAEDVLQQICEDYFVDTVFAYDEVCSQERRVDQKVRKSLVRTGTTLELLWGFTLYHLEDLDFSPKEWFPHTYSSFRKSLEEKSSIRPIVQHKRAQRRTEQIAEMDAGEIPTLADLGLPPAPPQDPRTAGPWRGGETAALAWTKDYIWKRNCLAQQYVGATMTTTQGKCAIGKDNTTKLSPWLAHGCLSPRYLYHEIEKYEKQKIKNKSTYWLKHELIWRDFVRFGGMAWGDSIFKIDGIKGQMKDAVWTSHNVSQKLRMWTEGKTGYPFCDSFMREIAATGYAVHCGRECVAWFLVRDLQLDWRLGAEYFEV
jgi:deoxyribodipyrimidine photo-lyase